MKQKKNYTQPHDPTSQATQVVAKRHLKPGVESGAPLLGVVSGGLPPGVPKGGENVSYHNDRQEDLYEVDLS